MSIELFGMPPVPLLIAPMQGNWQRIRFTPCNHHMSKRALSTPPHPHPLVLTCVVGAMGELENLSRCLLRRLLRLGLQRRYLLPQLCD